jgi:hypothetical protein
LAARRGDADAAQHRRERQRDIGWRRFRVVEGGGARLEVELPAHRLALGELWDKRRIDERWCD